ncbi:MAG: cysteine--tRNA ligase [Candidatus Altiarchaeota archaeon]
MVLKVYNTLSRSVEEFKPLKDGEVKVYICGLTVYDDMHIGHARTYLAFDAVLRYLKYRGHKVRYVQNITDIDDKIIKRAKERNVDPLQLTEEYGRRAYEDQRKLGLLEADIYPKVSETIPEIIDAVRKLVEGGYAYVTGSGVYFDVSKCVKYGELSHQDTEQLDQHRIEPDPEKRNQLDFSIWKRSKEGELGFESPWGRGRPGWHIECTVMSQKYLGDQLDIHGGALDLIFPHHENEIAQSESLTGRKPFVIYWMHTGFLNSSGEKMSKSLGNIIPVREFLKTYPTEAFRLFVLQTHYRSPVDYSTENVANAGKAVERLKAFRSELEAATGRVARGSGSDSSKLADELKESFISAMDDDFNTPKALAAVFDAVRKINSLMVGGGESAESLKHSLVVFDELLEALGFSIGGDIELSAEERELVDARNRHRALKNWAEADRVRSILLKRGIKVKDKSDGTTVIERLNA